MKKKLLITLAVFLALVMACSLLAVPALAVDAGDEVVTATKSVVGPDEDGYYTVTLSVTGSTYDTSSMVTYPADVVLCLDYSGSMKNQPSWDLWGWYTDYSKIDNVNAAARTFIDNLTEKGVKVGLVAFSNRVKFQVGLTTDADQLKRNLSRDANGGTNFGVPLNAAKNILDADQTSGVKKFVVLLSDGEPDDYYGASDVDGTTAFNQLTSGGVTVMTIGFDVANNTAAQNALKRISSPKEDGTDDKHFYLADNSETALNAVFAALEETIYSSLPRAKDVVMTDIVNGEFFEVVSYDSDELVKDGNTFSWDIGELGSETKTVTFKIKPKDGWIGTQFTNDDVSVTYTDAKNDTQGSLGKDDIGNPTVTVPGIIIKKTISPAGFAAPEGLAFEIRSGNNLVGTVFYQDFNNNGEGIVRLSPGTYTVTESGAEASGYTLTTVYDDGTPAASGTVTVPAGDVVNLNVTNTYTRDTGTLVIRKQFGRGSALDALPDGARFIVTGPADFGDNGTMVILWSEFANSAKTLTVPTGSYKVTESGAEAAGCTLSTAYDPEISTPDGPAGSGRVAKNGTATVTVTNTYTSDTGSLTITKALGEDSEKVAVPQGTRFTVTGPDGYSRTITYADFNENGSYLLRGLPAGDYTVSESRAEVDGYGLTTVYSPAGGKVAVKAGQTATVTVTNTYTEDDGGHVTPVSPVLNTEDHFAYIVGYPDGTVGPSREITRAEVSTIFFRMLTDEARAANWSTGNSFPDVSAGDWYNNAVSTLVKMGILYGYPDGTFRPDSPVTRAELVTMAVGFFQYDAAADSGRFSDISGHWAKSSILTAAKMGFIDGYPDGTFRPDNNITRAEAVRIINNVLNRAPHKDHLLREMVTWPDNMDRSRWYYADIQEATNSHEYTWSSAKKYEIWSKLLPVRDWVALEKAWEANSATNPGEVMGD